MGAHEHKDTSSWESKLATHVTLSMATRETSTGHIDSNLLLFQQIDAYSWDSDEEFQSGLHAILGPGPTPGQAETLTLRARCFYYSRQASRSFRCSAMDLH